MTEATAHRVAARRIDKAILIAWILVIAAARAGRSLDTDPFWQIRAGQDLLAGVPLIHADSWSWAPVDGLFYPNSPGWNVVLALFWEAAGFSGFFAATFLSIAFVLGLLAYLSLRMGAGYLVATAAVIVCSLGSWSMLSARPSVIAQGLLLVGIAVADRWLAHARRLPAWRTAVTMAIAGFALSLVGNWMHTSWGLLAVALAVAWVAFWLYVPRLDRRVRCAALVAGSVGLLAGLSAGPYGLQVFERSSAVTQVAAGLIHEWIPAVAPENSGAWLVRSILVLVLSALSAAQVVWHWRRRSRSYALAASLAVIAVPAAIAGLFVAVRFSGIAWLLVAPSLAMSVAQLIERSRARAAIKAVAHSDASEADPADSATAVSATADKFSSDALWRVVLGTAVVIVLPFALLLAAERGQPATVSALPSLPAGCRLFSTELDAASVILLRPDVQVWFDGRTDYWGRDRVIEAGERIHPSAPGEPAPPGTTCVLWPIGGQAIGGDANVLRALDASAAWRRVAQTESHAVWLPVRAN